MPDDKIPSDNNDEITNKKSSEDDSSNTNGKCDKYYDAKEISSLINSSELKNGKDLSRDLKSLTNKEDEVFKLKRKILDKAEKHYNYEYSTFLINLSDYYKKDLLDITISNEKKELYLESIHELEARTRGKDSSAIDEMIEAVKYMNALEERFEKKNIIKKESVIENFTNRIARKDGDSK